MSKNGLDSVGYTDNDCECLFYMKDYQGNVRAVIDQLGTLKEVNNYYPYGALMGGGTVGNNQSVQPYKYGTKELDRQNGLDWYDSQARMYDPLLGRTPTMDALSEKYYSISPYAWCVGNPIRLVDLDGMQVYMKPFMDFEKISNLDYSRKFIEDLRYETGLNVTINEETSILEYEKNQNGDPIILNDENGEPIGSSTARDQMLNLIDTEEIISVSATVKGGSKTDENSILLDIKQISNFEKGSNNLDPRTLGLGMTFIHETLHTKIGGNLKDDRSGLTKGDVVEKMNRIRQELNSKGGNFGQRLHYIAIPIKGHYYIGFDKPSTGFILNRIAPRKTKFIVF